MDDLVLCRICREEKFADEFPRGVTACRACRNAQRVDWAHSTPERNQRALAMRREYVARRKAAPGQHSEAQWQARLAEFRHLCAYCGAGHLPLVREHVVPVSAGGTNDIANLVPACQPCNARKGDRPLQTP